MTIEEVSKKVYPDIIPSNNEDYYPEYNEIALDGFIEGSSWAFEKASN